MLNIFLNCSYCPVMNKLRYVVKSVPLEPFKAHANKTNKVVPLRFPLIHYNRKAFLNAIEIQSTINNLCQHIRFIKQQNYNFPSVTLGSFTNTITPLFDAFSIRLLADLLTNTRNKKLSSFFVKTLPGLALTYQLLFAHHFACRRPSQHCLLSTYTPGP